MLGFWVVLALDSL